MSNAVANGLAGAGAGIIAQIITYPLQTVNTRQQTERVAKKVAPSRPASSTLLQILQVIRSEGWGGLYSGLKPSLFGTAASQTHTQAERKIMEAKKEALLKEASERNLIGSPNFQDGLAKLNAMKPLPYGTLHAAHEVYKEAGITGFWKGIIPTLIMVCNPSIQFMIYETSLKHLRAKRAENKQGLKTVTALEVFLLGALAKLGATVATYPLLVVKSRLQAKQEIGGNISLRYSGTFDAIIKMIRYEGLPGFYKGMSTKIVQSVFAASVLFMVKEELVKAYLVLADKSRKVLQK
ncbi:peroxisomal nicotinamide adenine dinucleotide carrier isoform X3 [Vitis vinifera]|uniref:peroxisomal nicotinamide adenine dinucleotide carrier isoform X3 n=1 Tax=Vitis vinifera TaxID=29760 RepID=UPI0008FEAF41|nr:peroxisomal nicotinamide adenine dinucleotide carrier isoform X3 [Vitis vinifera]|eukprot:XP_019072254.1 PREDICTED: peroxisomal nicotinamide adenine dinucleotide carrier isoform X3 [Vitis vinifera]